MKTEKRNNINIMDKMPKIVNEDIKLSKLLERVNILNKNVRIITIFPNRLSFGIFLKSKYAFSGYQSIKFYAKIAEDKKEK